MDELIGGWMDTRKKVREEGRMEGYEGKGI